MTASGTRGSAPFVAVVFNPVKIDEARIREAVAAASVEHAWAPPLFEATTLDDWGSGAARRAIDAGASAVLAAGGDGTVRAVAQELAGSGVPLVLIPSGTGNLLARNLGLSLERLDLAVAAAFTGRERRIDVGRAELERPDGSRERHSFLVIAGLGLDAQMIANTSPELKRRVGWPAYGQGIARSLGRRRNRVRLRYRLDDGAPHQLSVHTLLIGNCGLLPGNIQLLPEARVDDGVFDIVALRPKGLFGWIQIWLKVVWENGVLRHSTVGRKIIALTGEVRTLLYMKGKSIVVRPESPQEFQLDGDAFGEIAAVRVQVAHQALAVRVPTD